MVLASRARSVSACRALGVPRHAPFSLSSEKYVYVQSQWQTYTRHAQRCCSLARAAMAVISASLFSCVPFFLSVLFSSLYLCSLLVRLSLVSFSFFIYLFLCFSFSLFLSSLSFLFRACAIVPTSMVFPHSTCLSSRQNIISWDLSAQTLQQPRKCKVRCPPACHIKATQRRVT